MVKIMNLKRKNSPDTKGGGDTHSSVVLSGEGVLQTSGDVSSPRLSKASTQAVRVTAVPMARA
jgi:hypothetical protein